MNSIFHPSNFSLDEPVSNLVNSPSLSDIVKDLSFECLSPNTVGSKPLQEMDPLFAIIEDFQTKSPIKGKDVMFASGNISSTNSVTQKKNPLSELFPNNDSSLIDTPPPSKSFDSGVIDWSLQTQSPVKSPMDTTTKYFMETDDILLGALFKTMSSESPLSTSQTSSTDPVDRLPESKKDVNG